MCVEKLYTFFRFWLPWFETKKKIDAPKYAFTHRNLPESEKFIWIIQNVHEKSRFFYISITRQFNGVSCNQTLGCLRLYGNSRVSPAQPRINAYEILLQHDWLLFFFSRHINRFAETHSHLQLSYHITDRLLAAGNNHIVVTIKIYFKHKYGYLSFIFQYCGKNYGFLCQKLEELTLRSLC